MSNQNIKQLRSKDPEERKRAIKAVARAKDRKALRQLAIMVGDDPEPEIRDLARKAGVYIRQEIGELPKPVKEDAQKGKKTKTYNVTEEDEQLARKMVNAAMTAQIGGDKARMLKILAKAAETDPNLKEDAYFVTLLEGATGLQGAESLAVLDDEHLQNEIVETEITKKKNQQIEAHLEAVNAVDWTGVAFDLSLFFIVVTVGTMLLTFVALQSAQALVNRIDASYEAFFDNALDEDGEPIQPIMVDASFEDFSESLGELGLLQVLISGLVAGVGATVSLIAYCGAVHLSSRRLFGGQGSMQYLTHRWANLFTTRMIVIYLLMIFGVAVIFSAGGGVVVFIVAGIAGLISLLTFFKSISLVAQSYNFSFVKALLAVLIGGFLIGIANAALTTVANVSIL